MNKRSVSLVILERYSTNLTYILVSNFLLQILLDVHQLPITTEFILIFSHCHHVQAEAFVPDSIVRVGSRQEGREGVQTYEVHDKRVRLDRTSFPELMM